jgi:hypothetical protein
MKKFFVLFSSVLMAGAMMLVSCTDEPITPENQTPKYTITVSANDNAMGTVTGGGTYDSAATATLTATANEGYKFVNWDDRNENNPRIITVTENASYVAYFAPISGVNVTFGSTSWDAQYINAQLASDGFMIAAGQTNATSYPIVNLNSSSIVPGTTNGEPSIEVDYVAQTAYFTFGDPYLWYFEAGSIDFSSGTRTGDWWARPVTVNVTALDADAMTGSMTVNATMAHVTDLFEDGGLVSVDFNDCESRPLTMTVTNQTFTAAKMAIRVNEKVSCKLAK